MVLTSGSKDGDRET